VARLIRIEKPESGLDVFLKEISAYLSPQYQLAKRQEERADARLELSKRQMAENERRYQDSLTQQRFQNDISSQNAEINKETFELNKRNSEYAIARQDLDESFAGMNSRQLANANIDSFGIGIEDPTVNLRIKKYAQSRIDNAKEQFKTISNTLDLYNSQNPESPMTIDTALDVFKNDDSINKVFTDAYFSKGDLSPKERAQISTITPRLTSLRKQQSDLFTQQASGIAGADDALAEVTLTINKLQSKLDNMLGFSSSNISGSNIDAYSNQGASETTTELPDFLIPDDKKGIGDFVSNDMYNVLFSDEESTLDNAVDVANRNASGEDVKDVVIEQGDEQQGAMNYTMNSVQEAVDSGEIKNEEDARELDIPESIISGLNFAQAGATSGQPTPPTEDLDLFPVLKTPQQEQVKSNETKKKKTRSRFLPLIDFNKRLEKINSFEKQLKETPVKNKNKQNRLNARIDKVKKSIARDFSKVYDGAMSVENYLDVMSRNDLARLISIYKENQDSVSEADNPNSFKNTMKSGVDNMLEGLGTTLDLLQYRNPYR
tara:strand:- start:518 stop:2161 length:1644 start_codon:yes stop_codon:yes gene_type:complete